MVITAAVAALSVMAAISGSPDSQSPIPQESSGADPAALPVSIERIRDALERPPALTIPPLPEPIATFRSGIENTAPFESVLEGMRRELALWSGANSIIHPPGSSFPPSRSVGGVDVLPLISAAFKQWKTARARDRVSKELAAFCAVNDCSVVEGQRDGSPADGTPSPR